MRETLRLKLERWRHGWRDEIGHRTARLLPWRVVYWAIIRASSRFPEYPGDVKVHQILQRIHRDHLRADG